MNTRPLVAHIRSILLADPVIQSRVESRVYTWHEDGKREKNMSNSLPEITHIDGPTSLMESALDIFRTVYQVSVWDTTLAGTRDLV